MIFTAVQNTQPDYIALAMVAVLAVIVIIMAARKKLSLNKKAIAPVVEIAEEEPKPVAPGSAGELKLHDVPPKTAAMLMAIVADKTGKPLNELRFTSIKEVKE